MVCWVTEGLSDTEHHYGSVWQSALAHVMPARKTEEVLKTDMSFKDSSSVTYSISWAPPPNSQYNSEPIHRSTGEMIDLISYLISTLTGYTGDQAPENMTLW